MREYQENQLLLLSTLDGSLYAVDRQTGITMWQLKDGMNIFILKKLSPKPSDLHPFDLSFYFRARC